MDVAVDSESGGCGGCDGIGFIVIVDAIVCGCGCITILFIMIINTIILEKKPSSTLQLTTESLEMSNLKNQKGDLAVHGSYTARLL